MRWEFILFILGIIVAVCIMVCVAILIEAKLTSYQLNKKITERKEKKKMAEKIIEIADLKKFYGDVQAVKGIDFYVEKGKLFAFLGPNGAGKSTTIDIITTFLKKDSGTVLIDGCSLDKDKYQIREKIGAVFQDNVLDARLTVQENIFMRGSLYGLKDKALQQATENAIQIAEVEDFKNRMYGKLSGGQRRRADIARALVHTPKILFLDEPTTGLDPQTRKSVWKTIRRLQNETGMTVFLTTHYMEEAAEADYVVVVNHGEIAAKGTPTMLKERYAADFLKIMPKSHEHDSLVDYLNSRSCQYNVIGGIFKIPIKSTISALPILNDCQDKIESFEVVNGTMDDAFITIIGEETDND